MYRTQREVDLLEMFKIETSEEERTQGQRRTANWSEPKTADSGVELVKNAYTQGIFKDWKSTIICGERYS